VWMIECRRCLRFLNEALDATLVNSDFAGEEFQSHWPTEFRILSAVNFSHSSRTDLADDAILGQRNSGRKFSHCCFLRDWPDCRKLFNARRVDDRLQ
ncbi:MAG TPA: hypothetical protein VFT02_00870, partial [Pyrinomonadaceae bacterium]|nr:hypothetical protein [Pyrinomonadaceae bacterium]